MMFEAGAEDWDIANSNNPSSGDKLQIKTAGADDDSIIPAAAIIDADSVAGADDDSVNIMDASHSPL